MPKLGRPRGRTVKTSVTRALNLPGELYNKCIWIADRWTKEALIESGDGVFNPEYWTFSRVISSVMAEYFASLEANDPELVTYFENCRQREQERLQKKSPV